MIRAVFSGWLALVLLMACAWPAWAQDPVETGLEYLATQQQADGGFTNGFSEGSDLGTTCDTILAIAAAGQDASTWVSDKGNSPLDYLHAQVAAGTVDALGLKAKTALALLATGQDPAAFAGSDLIAELNAAYDEASGGYGSSVFDQALVMLTLSAAGERVPSAAAEYLLDMQGEDGAWSLFGGAEDIGDTNTSALAIQALCATGHCDEIGEAFTYLHQVQNKDGGFPYQNPSDYGTDTDANSTAIVLQALLAAGESLSEWSPAGKSPLEALNALHDSDSGGFLWQAAVPGANVLATAQAIPALAGYTFVDLPRVAAAQTPGGVTSPGGAVLPESGGLDLSPMGVIGLAMVALGAGMALRRRRR
jgi:LPXTG-motif cell wall-anchored protein